MAKMLGKIRWCARGCCCVDTKVMRKIEKRKWRKEVLNG